MLPLQSVYVIQWPLSVLRSGAPRWYLAGTASVAATSVSWCLLQPSGSVRDPANGLAISRYAVTAATTTSAPSPNHALRRGSCLRPGPSTYRTSCVGTGAGGFATDARTARTWAAFGRFEASLARRAVMRSASGPGAEVGGAGAELRTDWRVAGVLLRRNGETPSVAAYRTTPRDQRSDAGPGRWPNTRSGAMYSGDPTKPPVSVRLVSPSICAMPKSVRTTRSWRPSRTLSGFTSRCRTPAAWAASRAPSTWRPMRAASRASRVPSCNASPSERPVTSSITIHG